ncbi:hypothetical protein PBY51_005384 [Eleginops maclovinus]|uniref:Uncharacterized protein n=1 Tax=Eleginops maclovinus TaxID=56733 RepID=A0AAN8AHI7_ELEMC|nr:hypothetical protein PBY51_005384 [Eleginops maclovinus]
MGFRPAPQPCGHRPELSTLPLLPLSGPQVYPPSLPPTLLPKAPTGLPPSPHQLQPIPCSEGPSLCDPEGCRVRRVRGRSPHCYSRHLSEVSASEALQPGRLHTARGDRDPPFSVNNGLFLLVFPTS